jgi:hypothetical protein
VRPIEPNAHFNPTMETILLGERIEVMPMPEDLPIQEYGIG